MPGRHCVFLRPLIVVWLGVGPWCGECWMLAFDVPIVCMVHGAGARSWKPCEGVERASGMWELGTRASIFDGLSNLLTIEHSHE